MIVPSTTLPLTNNLSFQGVLGGTLSLWIALWFFGVSFVWPDEGTSQLMSPQPRVPDEGKRADAYPCHHRIHTTGTHILVVMIAITTRHILDVGIPPFLSLPLASSCITPKRFTLTSFSRFLPYKGWISVIWFLDFSLSVLRFSFLLVFSSS